MTAKEYWMERFGEYPQSDADKLAVAMMQDYQIFVEKSKPEYSKLIDRKIPEGDIKYFEKLKSK